MAAVNVMVLVKKTMALLEKNKATLGCAESCTGGLLSAYFTDIPGSSKYFLGGFVTYSNEMKQKFLKVTLQDLKTHGAVSEVVAKKMAVRSRHQLNSTFSLSITGVAGPGGGSKEKPVGTVWFGVSGPNFVYTEKKRFRGNRQKIRKSAVGHALLLLIKKINNSKGV